MATIRARGNRFQVRWRQDGKEVSETFKTRANAIKFRDLVDAAGQRYPAGWIPRHGFAEKATSGPTLADWFERAINARVRPNERTKADYRRDFARHVPEWLAGKSIDQITNEDVGLWLNGLKDSLYRGGPIGNKTRHNIHNMVSGAMRDAQRDGLITRNPFEGRMSGISTKPTEEMVFLTPEEFTFVRGYVTPYYRDFITLLFGTGLRISEATALHPSAVQIERGRLHIHQAWKRAPKGRSGKIGDTKTDRSNRYVSLSEGQLDLLKPRLGDPELVFRNMHRTIINGNTFNYDIWRPAVNKARKDGLDKKPRVHDLRHSHASVLLANGMSMMAVSRRLGHSGIKVRDERYAHLLPSVDEQMRDVLRRQDEWLL